MAKSDNNLPAGKNPKEKPISRKHFFKYAGASALSAVAVGLYGCSGDSTGTDPESDTVNLGSGDTGILNYAYALEQLEAAFYIKVTTEDSWMESGDKALFEDIRDHEIAHRDWFKAVIKSRDENALIRDLTPKFDAFDLSTRYNVLVGAKLLEDTGVRAYNGVGHLIKDADYLVEAGKIVSVEARHAAAISSLINPGSADFAGDISANGTVDASTGLDGAVSPIVILRDAGNFIKDKIDASGLPKPQVKY